MPVASSATASAVDLARPIGRPIRTAQAQNWGWLPALSLASAVGLWLVGLANTLSRSGAGEPESLFWVGLLTLVVPAAARLASSEPSRGERIGLLVMVGLGLYLVKVLHSPYAFTFSDELVHLHNGNRILQTGSLFSENSILSVTPLYPGLETVTAALASLSGLSVSGAGLVVVGAARLVMMLALYLLYEQVGGSPRLAGIAALLYTANSNFLFWSAQFSYESVALPLAVLVLFAAARRADTHERNRYTGLTLTAMLGVAAVVITHHLSSYFLATFFIVWTVLLLRPRLEARVRDAPGPGGLALFSAIVCLVWLVYVASLTIGYLSPVLSRAIESVIQMIAGGASQRELFRSAAGSIAPVWERVIGISSVLLMLLGVPSGLRRIWQRYRSRPIALMLAGMALAYFGMLGLRLSSAAWETGNRASEYLFVGLAFTLAFTAMELWNFLRRLWSGRAVVLGSVAIISMGGVIAGWAPALRLGRPYQVAVGNITVEPQGVATARWMRAVLGPNNRVAADESNGRLMLAYGGQYVLAGRYPNIKDLLITPNIPDWQVHIMQTEQIRYVVVDRRLISWDNMAGLYFDETNGGPIPDADLFAPEIVQKFDKPKNVSRIFDSGHVVIYDVKAIRDATPDN